MGNHSMQHLRDQVEPDNLKVNPNIKNHVVPPTSFQATMESWQLQFKKQGERIE
jgi:hypothetical protein